MLSLNWSRAWRWDFKIRYQCFIFVNILINSGLCHYGNNYRQILLYAGDTSLSLKKRSVGPVPCNYYITNSDHLHVNFKPNHAVFQHQEILKTFKNILEKGVGEHLFCQFGWESYIKKKKNRYIWKPLCFCFLVVFMYQWTFNSDLDSDQN